MLRLANFKELVDSHIAQNLLRAGGPQDFDRNLLPRAKAKVQPLVVGADVTAGGRRETRLAINAHTRAVAIAIAACTAHRYIQPMIAAACAVKQQDRRSAESRDEHVPPAA